MDRENKKKQLVSVCEKRYRFSPDYLGETSREPRLMRINRFRHFRTIENIVKNEEKFRATTTVKTC